MGWSMKRGVTMNNNYNSVNFIKISKKALVSYQSDLSIAMTSICLVISSLSHIALASLSISSANTIRGEAPQILPTADDKILDGIQFKLKVADGQNLTFTPGSLEEIHVAFNVSPNDYTFDVDLSDLAVGDIYDNDGDTLASTKGFVIDSITAEWTDSNSKSLDANSQKALGSNLCNNDGYKGDASVKVTVNFHAVTEYGDPRVSDIREVSKTFKIKPDDGLCYIQPGVLALNIPNGWPEGNNYLDAGSNMVNRTDAYDASQFIPHKGFIVSAKSNNGKSFPTTAFPEARFRLVPLNTIPSYSYTIVNNPNSALISTSRNFAPNTQSEFKFTDNVPAVGENFVIAVTNNDTKATFTYTFSLEHWFYPYKGDSMWMPWNKAQDFCTSNGDRLPTRSELSNSVYAYGDFTDLDNVGYYAKNNGYKRAIGDSLTGEWGKLYYYAPLDKIGRDMMNGINDLQPFFLYEYYFTSEKGPRNTRYYSVGSVEGNVIIDPDYAYAICVKY